LGAASCGAPADETAGEEKSSPIVNGSPTTAVPGVGMLINSATGDNCSASLIGSQEIMTAAHCIAVNPHSSFSIPGFQLLGSGTAPANIFFQVDRDSLNCATGCPGVPNCDGTTGRTCCDRANNLPNGACARDYAVDRLFPQGTATGTNDIAIGHLTEVVANANALPVGTMEPSNTTLTVMGYGCFARNLSDFGVKRFLSYFFSGQNSHNLCPGDSGGPVFIGPLLGGGAIVRVNSAINGSPTDPNAPDMGADVPVNASAVTAMVSVMNGAGIAYRPQMQSLGFHSPAAANGNVIGSETAGLRLEGVQVWSPEPGVIPMYQARVQGIPPNPASWKGYVSNGVLAGTVGQQLRMEAFELFLSQPGPHNDVAYQAFVHGQGWGDLVFGNEGCNVDSDCGTSGVLCGPDFFCAVGKVGGSIEALAMQLF
jgi:hypothetical protein